jgi:hypothetical protein
MSNKKLSFALVKKTPHNYNSKKLIFTKLKILPFKDNLLTQPKHDYKQSKETFSVMKHTIKPVKLSQKQPQNQQSLGEGVNHGLHTRAGIGLYPVPTGRILRTYAKNHNLLPISTKDKKIMDQIPFSLQGLLKNPRPVQKKVTHEQRERMSYDQIVASSPKRYMAPFEDEDGDGVVNMADCKPLNKKKQDDEFDQYGNTLPDKESFIRSSKNDAHIISKLKPVRWIEVQTKQKDIETIETNKTNKRR